MSQLLKSRCSLLLLVCLSMDLIAGTWGLRCYSCVSLQCSSEEQICDRLRSMVISEAKSLYYFGNSVPVCPVGRSNSTDWKAMLADGSGQCPEKYPGRQLATCALGRVKVDLLDKSTMQGGTYYATITGCATEDLLRRINQAMKKSQCEIQVKTIEEAEQSFGFQMEHCFRGENLCHVSDNCIPPKETAVKRWGAPEKAWKSSFIISGILLLAVVYLSLISYGLFIHKCWSQRK